MQISDNQVKKMLEMGVAQEIEMIYIRRIREENDQLVKDVVVEVNAMDDREDRIAELRARIENGSYNPSGAETADAMIRRAAADKIG